MLMKCYWMEYEMAYRKNQIFWKMVWNSYFNLINFQLKILKLVVLLIK